MSKKTQEYLREEGRQAEARMLAEFRQSRRDDTTTAKMTPLDWLLVVVLFILLASCGWLGI